MPMYCDNENKEKLKLLFYHWQFCVNNVESHKWSQIKHIPCFHVLVFPRNIDIHVIFVCICCEGFQHFLFASLSSIYFYCVAVNVLSNWWRYFLNLPCFLYLHGCPWVAVHRALFYTVCSTVCSLKHCVCQSVWQSLRVRAQFSGLTPVHWV